MDFSRIQRTAFSFCACLFFALSLAVPSGYSYGAAGMSLLAIGGVAVLRPEKISRETWLLLGVMLVMGLTWGFSFDTVFSLTGSDLWPRYWLAALALVIGSVWGVTPRAVLYGLAVGALGALGVAAYQYLALGWVKATGHTNAIQFGGIAMYLGMAVWAIALFSKRRVWVVIVLWAVGACGVLASLMSETRGAWVVAPLLMLCMLVVLFQQGKARLACGALIAAFVLMAAVMIPYGEKFGGRAQQAFVQLEQYLQNPEQGARASIGQRLEQWRVALQMIERSPLTGWGTRGVVVQKQALVDQGAAHPSIMKYGHAHNEIIDMLVKRGALGGAALLLFYLIPLCLFWPTHKRLRLVAEPMRPTALGVRMAAALLPIAYFGFGWTQVFFAHNSGNMFYLFSIVVFWGALQSIERSYQAS